MTDPLLATPKELAARQYKVGHIGGWNGAVETCALYIEQQVDRLSIKYDDATPEFLAELKHVAAHVRMIKCNENP